MLTGLDFEVARAAAPPAPNRTDVACFVGFVARRRRVTLPAAVRTQLRAAGWIDGPWRLPPERPIEELLHIPVVVEDWETFARLFAWEARALRADGAERCASYLGAAVRSFFAEGGRRAVVIRVADPWPYIGAAPRADVRQERLAQLVPALGGFRPFDATDPRTWRGIEHLYGLPEVSHVCVPDLADVCAVEPEATPAGAPAPAAPEVFVECSVSEPPLPVDSPLRRVAAPRVDRDGFDAWVAAEHAVRQFLADHRRDALTVAALPLPHDEARAALAGEEPAEEPEEPGEEPAGPEEGEGSSEPSGAHAHADWLTFLHQSHVLEGETAPEVGRPNAASAFVQLLWPWLGTARSTDLPEHLEPAEGLFAGVLAANALGRGTFRSVAGTPLPSVARLEPVPDLGLGADSPTARLAERVCLIGPEPDGVYVLSDVTSSPDRAWRSGGVSRLMSALLRAARRTGETHLFDPNGPELWARVRGSLENLLDGFYSAGALGGKSRAEAFTVRCDLSTMSQNDLDNGRLRAEITVLPASAIARITVSLELGAGGAETRLPEVS